MSLFTRITATVASTVDKAVTRVEDHNAIIDASIRQTRKAAASARVRLARVRKDGEALTKRREELVVAELNWTDRAIRSAEDKEKAVECLARRKKCRSEIQRVEDSLNKHRDLEQNLAANLTKIEQRLREINEQRNMLRTRESVAEATRIIDNIQGADTSDIEQAFDRWEVRVGESEIFTESASTFDDLETSFADEENRSELLLELEELVTEENRK